ncbi:MAG: tetratricopeptide repeat protein [Thermoanaerobaculia bacterium]
MRCVLRPLAVLAGAVLFSSLAFGAEGRFSGAVVDEGGQPVAGASITVTTPSLASVNLTLTTDETGRWSTEVPNSGWTYSIRAQADGFSPSQTQMRPNGTKDTRVDMTLHPPIVPPTPPAPKIDPGVVSYNEGVDFLQKGDKEGAEKKFDAAVAAKPDLAAAWKVLSQLSYERKDYAKALASGRKALELDPKDNDLYGILMDSSQKSGDSKGALEYKTKFVEANADNPEVNYNSGVEMYNAGDYPGAAAAFNKAISLKSDMANAHFWLGMSEYNMKRYPQSRTQFQKYLELAPKGDQAQTAREMLAALPPK